ncbi:molybdopterin molybdotransferase MoeA [Methylosoma difficile]
MIDTCSLDSQPLLTLDQALEKILAAIEPLRATETLPLADVLGRVLAAAIYSPINMPFERNAAMDGYAFARADACASGFSLELVGVSWAGRPFLGMLKKGQCVRIFTGAVVPEGADSVVMQEHVTVQGAQIHFPENEALLQNVRSPGEDVRQGACLMAAGKKLGAYDLALLASVGVANVDVVRSVRIRFFSTGDELMGLGQALSSGKIYDSNRYLLAGLLVDPAHASDDGGVVADDEAVLEQMLVDAAQYADVIITTGGASVGDADYVNAVLARCGQVKFWKMAVKPGKPVAFGRLGGAYFFGLPGNPVAVAATFSQLLLPALAKLSGSMPVQALRLQAVCGSPLKKAKGRLEFQRGILSQSEAGIWQVVSAGGQGSNMLGSLSRSNCFIVLPADCGGVAAGDWVTVEPFAARL